MKSKARRTIEKWDKVPLTKEPAPVALGSGVVAMYPSRTAVPRRYHLTSRYVRYTPSGRQVIEYVCSCPGFWGGADCWHVKDLRKQIGDEG